MAGRLENKNAFITGGASGLGRATAIRFAQEGANVFIADVAAQQAEKVAGEVRALGRKAFFQAADTSDEAQVDAAVARAVAELGNIDILVAAAGLSHPNYRLGEKPGSLQLRPVTEITLAQWRKLMSVNLDGVFLTVRAAAREMVKAGKGGRIITVASAAARIATPGMADYTASKAGVWGLTNTVAKELAQYGITANTIGPGLMDTPMAQDYINMVRGQEVPQSGVLALYGEPNDVANTALFLASDEAKFYTGSIFFPDGGATMH
jgi:NAD(P)-dependent dehydrogenase (short-subunit alcohol dehydrogenase family)